MSESSIGALEFSPLVTMLRNFANLRDAGVFHWGIGVQPFGDYPVNQDGAFFFEELDEALFFGNECAYSIVFATQRSLAVTSSGDRLYVPLSGSSSVALVDPIVLQQVDTQILTPGVNPIPLPNGAQSRWIMIDPWSLQLVWSGTTRVSLHSTQF